VARLYLEAESDKKKPFKKTAKTNFHFKVLWGEKSNQNLVADITVNWSKDRLFPKIIVKHPTSIKLEETN